MDSKLRFWHPLFATWATRLFFGLDTSFLSKFWCPPFFNCFREGNTIRPTPFNGHIEKIFFLSGYKKMFWITARRIITAMTNIFPFGNRTFINFVCYSVNHFGNCFFADRTDKDIPISTSIFGASPDPTPGRFFMNIFEQSFLECV